MLIIDKLRRKSEFSLEIRYLWMHSGISCYKVKTRKPWSWGKIIFLYM